MLAINRAFKKLSAAFCHRMGIKTQEISYPPITSMTQLRCFQPSVKPPLFLVQHAEK